MRATRLPIALGEKFRMSKNVPQLDKLDRCRDLGRETIWSVH